MKKKILIVIGIVVVIAMIMGISYALWLKVFQQTGENVVTSDCFKVTLEEDTNSNIYLEKSFPISEREGVRLKPYHFTIHNVCTSIGNYQINLETMSNNTMPNNVMRVKLNEEDSLLLTEEVESTIGEHAYKIGSGVIYAGESISYDLRVWMDEATTMNDGASNKEFVGKVSIVASYTNESYKEEILHGMDPVLKDGLIPVTISDNGVVHKASLNSKWYSYANQEWANAVILEDESIQYEDFEEIPEENIESYFVWIPRYKYQLFNLGEYPKVASIDESVVQTINIVFGDDITDDSRDEECTTPMLSGETGNCKVGDYMTHPTFLSFNVNGIWVGKFETGYKGATSKSGAEKNEVNLDKIQVKPNVYSWGSINAANAHLNSYNYKREYDSHMMKNTEWGAVAYLQHSVYGSQKSVRINNNSNYITGYAAKEEPTAGLGKYADYQGTALGVDGTKTYNYTNPESVSASTTNNYTGIYDMSGGRRDYVAGVMTGKGSVSFPEEKYYDEYVYNASYTTGYNLRILGDATGEVGPFASATYGSSKVPISSWYKEEAYFVESSQFWFRRGGYYSSGLSSGVFAFNDVDGGGNSYGCFRIVLAF